VLSSTVTTYAITPPLPAAGAVAVITQDRAGNRSVPVIRQVTGGKVNVALILDNSLNMDAFVQVALRGTAAHAERQRLATAYVPPGLMGY
jgi:hypothetical protein